MAELNDSQREKGKVQMRNLHPELQALIKGAVTSGSIAMKDFSPEMQETIHNILNTGSSGTGYNDSELREKIGALEYNKADRTELRPLFNKNNDKIDITMLNGDVATVVQNAASKADLLKYRPVSRDITYNDLDSDLKIRINNSSLQPGEGGTGISEANLAEIKVQLNQHETGINNNANTIASLSDRMDSLSSLSSLASLPETVAKNTNNIQTLSGKLNDFLGENDPDNMEKGKIGLDRLKNAVVQQLTLGTTAYDKVDKLIPRITQDEADIASLQTSFTDVNTKAEEALTKANANTANIDKLNTDITTQMTAIDNKVNDLNLDTILAKTIGSEDMGKIQTRHLSNDIVNSLDQVAVLEERITANANAITSAKTIVGTLGQFAYKGSKATTTKSILNTAAFYTTKTNLDVEPKTTEGFIIIPETSKVFQYNPDKTHVGFVPEDRPAAIPSTDTEDTTETEPSTDQNTDNGSQDNPETPDNLDNQNTDEPTPEGNDENETPSGEEGEGGNGETSDPGEDEPPSEDAPIDPGSEEEPGSTSPVLVEREVLGTWEEVDDGLLNEVFNYTFIYDTVGLRLYYNNNGNLMLIDVGSQKYTELTVEPNGSAKVNEADAMRHINNVLVLDEELGSRTYKTYVNAEAYCTLSYTDEYLCVYNDTENALKVRILYS